MVNDLSECICYKCDLGRPVSGKVVHCGKDKRIAELEGLLSKILRTLCRDCTGCSIRDMACAEYKAIEAILAKKGAGK